MKPAKYALGIVALTAACAVPTVIASALLGENPAVGGGAYSSGGGLSVATDLRENNGKTMVCGVWAQSRQQSILTKGRARDVMETGSIFVGGDKILQGLAFFREVSPSPSYSGQQAGCATTDRAWRAGDTDRPAVIRIPRQIVYRDIDEGLGVVVTFVPGAPSAGN